MQMIWVNTPSSRYTAALSILFGLLLLVFSPFIPGVIGIFLAAVILIISLGILGLGFTMKGSGFSIPFLIVGFIGIFLSLYALLNPDVTVSLMGILLGIVILLMGMAQLFMSPGFIHDNVSRFFLIFGGILTILVGFYMILNPQEGMQLLMIFLGCYLIVYGIIGLFRKNNTNIYY